MFDDVEIQTIVKYEMDKIIKRLIKDVEFYNCSGYQKECRDRGKCEQSCRAVQATTQLITERLKNWAIYL